MNAYEKIIDLLNTNDIKFHELNHEPVFTCEEAVNVPGFLLGSGLKTLLLKSKNTFYLVAMPGNSKLDNKKAKALFGSDVHLANPGDVRKIMDCEVGCCYPFGSLFGLETYIDESVKFMEQISLNPGRHDKTIVLSLVDFLKVTKVKNIDIVG